MMLKINLELFTDVIEFEAAKTKRFFGELHAAKKGIQAISNAVMSQAFGENPLIEGGVMGHEDFWSEVVSEIIPQIGKSRSIAHVLPGKAVNTGKNKPAGRRPD
jgi:hypothetical protein